MKYTIFILLVTVFALGVPAPASAGVGDSDTGMCDRFELNLAAGTAVCYATSNSDSYMSSASNVAKAREIVENAFRRKVVNYCGGKDKVHWPQTMVSSGENQFGGDVYVYMRGDPVCTWM